MLACDPLLGDFNGDNAVNAADYTVWRDALASEVAPMTGADHSGDGVVGVEDYEIWRSNFGATATPMDHPGHGDPGHGSPHSPSPALMALVPDDQATNTVVANGLWSNPNVWSNQTLPTDGARIVIPHDYTVTVDSEITEEFKTIRIDGTLNFATDRDTELRVDTLVSTRTGELRIGDACNPVEADHTATIVFADDGAIDRTWDPNLLSRGALLHGKTTIHGAEKTAFLPLAAGGVAAGTMQITLASPPTGWRVGDQITIAGVDPNDPASDEVVTIAGIDGSTITLGTELVRDHIPPRADLEVHVANLTRNVQFTSENTDVQRRGHVMFMHTNDVDARYFSFRGLGRTDKSIELQDWRLVSDSEGSIGDLVEVQDLGGFNVRGRYSLHFHRGGPSGAPALIQGVVVRDDPGWAYVNHSSNVDFLDNVAHNTTGAAYNTEAGDEIGSFVRNIAIRTVNPSGNPNPPDIEINEDQSPDFRVLTQDFGWQGDGFWFHGAGVTVEDNVVSGASGHGFIYWTLGLVEKGLGENQVLAGNLPNGHLIGGPDTLVRTKHVPVPSFDGNSTYSAPKGLLVAYLHTDNRDENDDHFVGTGELAPVPQSYEDTLQSTFSNYTAWNVPLSGISAPYSGRLTFEGIDVLGTGAEGSVGIKLDQFANQNDITVRNINVDGYLVGVAAQRQGEAIIDGAVISAPTGIRISAPNTNARNLEISNVQFVTPSGLFEPGEEWIRIDMNEAWDIGLAGGLFGIDEFFYDEATLLYVPPVFQKDRITLNTPGYENVGLYFDSQSPSFRPIPAGGELSAFVPNELVGLTNAQLQQQYGISFSDVVWPAGTRPDALVPGARIGPASPSFEAVPSPS
ncbi:MAG: G8 domain-containing protein, partial [Planctomycetota bacterium]